MLLHRKSSQHSNFSEKERMDNLAREELARLERRLRLTENNRKAYREDTENLLRRQRLVLEGLQKDQEELTCNLKLATCESNLTQDKAAANALIEMLKKEDLNKLKIQSLKEEISELDQQLATVEKLLGEQQSQMGGYNSLHMAHVAQRKRIRILEGKLNTNSQALNVLVSKNNDMKQEIDHLLQDRALFNRQYLVLSEKVSKNKQEILDILDQANHAYDQRDDARARINALQERMRRDNHTYQAEMQDLLRTLDHDGDMQQFMAKKVQERRATDLEKETMDKALHRDKTVERTAEEQLQVYKSAYSMLKKLTGVDEASLMLDYYRRQEEHNYAVFNYVSELQGELEALQEGLGTVKLQIEQATASTTEQYTRQRIAKLEEELEKARGEAEMVEGRLDRERGVLEQIQGGIDTVFRDTDGDRSPALALLGNNEEVNRANLLLYLTLAEQRVNELLLVKQYMAYTAAGAGSRAATPGVLGSPRLVDLPPASLKQPATDGTGVVVEATTTQQADDIGDAPMTLSTIKLKVTK